MAQSYCGRKISDDEKKFLLLQGLQQMVTNFKLDWDPKRVKIDIYGCYANAYYHVGGYAIRSELFWDCLKWRYFLNVELRESFYIE